MHHDDHQPHSYDLLHTILLLHVLQLQLGLQRPISEEELTYLLCPDLLLLSGDYLVQFLAELHGAAEALVCAHWEFVPVL